METTEEKEITPAAPAMSTGEYPVQLDIPYPETSSRLWALGTLLFFIPKFVALIPHIIVLYILGMITLPVLVLGQLAVLFIGRYPRPLFNFMAGVTRWRVRVNAFMFGLTDNYPPFSFK